MRSCTLNLKFFENGERRSSCGSGVETNRRYSVIVEDIVRSINTTMERNTPFFITLLKLVYKSVKYTYNTQSKSIHYAEWFILFCFCCFYVFYLVVFFYLEILKGT